MTEDKIIDIHAHIFPDKVAGKAVQSIGKYYGMDMACPGTVAGLLESGNRIKVSRYVVHSTATQVEQVRTINGFIAEAQRANPSFIGFGTLHSGLEDMDSEVGQVMALGLKGIKLHPEFQGFNIDDREMLPLYKALEGKLPILMHMGDAVKTSSSPKRLLKILNQFPDLTVIAAHLGGYQMWGDSMEYLVGKNVYFDTSSTLAKLDRPTVLKIIRSHGVDKVLFGSDYPMWSHEDELERFNSLGLLQEEREKILWKNAQRLLGL